MTEVKKVINKLAALTTYTWNKLNTAIRRNRDLNDIMVELGDHFRVDQEDASRLLDLKKKQMPDTGLTFIDKYDKGKYPMYNPETNEIFTYNEPWSFLHEYGHAYERADKWDKVRRLLPLKHRLTKEQEKLLNDYIREGYMEGNPSSRRVGEFLDRVIKDSQNRKEGDVWRLTEELRANARAYKDTKLVTGKNNANKVLQPLSVSDMSYIGAFYPDEFSKLMNVEKPPVAEHVKNSDVINALRRKLDKARYGLPE
jgi:hypothetical protein